VLEAQEILEAKQIKEADNEKDWHRNSKADKQFSRAETDDRFGSSRSLELILRFG